jgi:dTDP-4-dehydrorhamnose reductase
MKFPGMDIYRSIVITGGSGMLAQALAEQLRGRGIEPVLLAHAQLDITQAPAVRAVFEQYRPTLLLNCAAHTGVDQCEQEPERANAINGDAVRLLADTARDFGTRLVHFSTDFVFDGQSHQPYRPEDAPNPLSAYGKSKRLGEVELAAHAPPGWMILRTSWLFGRPGNCFPQTIVNLARKGTSLTVVNDQLGCPTYALDLAAATFDLLDVGAQGIQHVTNEGQTTWFDFAQAILKAFDLTAEITPVTTAQWTQMRPHQARRPAYSVLDTRFFFQATGNALRHWSAALRDYRTLSWAS